MTALLIAGVVSILLLRWLAGSRRLDAPRYGHRSFLRGGKLWSTIRVLFLIVLTAALSAGISVRQELQLGPTRLVEAVGADYWLLTDRQDNLINGSAIESDIVERLHTVPGLRVSATVREFYTYQETDDLLCLGLDDSSSLFAVPLAAGRYPTVDQEITVDEGLGLKVGESLEFGGYKHTVVGLTKTGPTSLGATLVLAPNSMMQRMMLFEHYTLVALKGEIPKWVSQLPRKWLLTSDEFAAGNRAFWGRQSNSLALTLVALVGLVALLGVAMWRALQAVQERRELGVLKAIGREWKDVRRILQFDGLFHLAWAFVPSVILAQAIVWRVNQTTSGFGASVTPGTHLVAAAASAAIGFLVINGLWFYFRKITPAELTRV